MQTTKTHPALRDVRYLNTYMHLVFDALTTMHREHWPRKRYRIALQRLRDWIDSELNRTSEN